jgi:hypothetical protein
LRLNYFLTAVAVLIQPEIVGRTRNPHINCTTTKALLFRSNKAFTKSSPGNNIIFYNIKAMEENSLTRELTKEELAEFRSAFDMFDIDGGGTLTYHSSVLFRNG